MDYGWKVQWNLITAQVNSDTSETNIIRTTNNASSILQLYPQPASNFITIKTGELRNGRLAIYNIDGKMLRLETMKHKSQITLNTEDFKSGIYTAVYQNEEGIISKQFVISHK